MSARNLIIALGLVVVWGGLGAGVARADFLLTGTDHLDVTTSHTVGSLYGDSTADVLAGGYIEHALVSERARLSVHRPSGNAIDTVQVYQRGRIAVFSGNVGEAYAYDTSAITLDGGQVHRAETNGTSRMTIMNGSVGSRLDLYDDSTASVTGGSVHWLVPHEGGAADIRGGTIDYLSANGSASAEVRGGSVAVLYAYGTCEITLHGSDFQATDGLSLQEYAVVGGVPQYEVIGKGILSGMWFDGTPWTMTVSGHDAGATIRAVPEPASLSLLAVGVLGVLRRRKR